MFARDRGVSLLELVVGFGLLLLVSTILVQVLIPSMRATSEIQRRVELRQSALVACRWLERDLQETPLAGVAIQSGPTVLTVQPLREIAGDAAQVWDQKLVAYSHRQEQLWRGEWNSTTTTPNLSLTLYSSRPTRPPPSDLQLLAGGLTKSKPIAKNLAVFTITHSGLADAVASPLKFAFEFRMADSTEEFYKFQKTISSRMSE